MSYLDTNTLNKELDEIEGSVDEDDPETALDDDDAARLEDLRELRDAIGDDWQYGVTLIPEDEFEDHARQTAEEIGAIDSDASWPATCIDWERAARDLSSDYTSVTFDGTDYYFQA